MEEHKDLLGASVLCEVGRQVFGKAPGSFDCCGDEMFSISCIEFPCGLALCALPNAEYNFFKKQRIFCSKY